MAYDHILQGKHGSTYYARLIGRWSGLLWDDTNSELATNPAYADQVVSLTEIADDGDFGFNAPASLPIGQYKLSYRLQAGGSPANTDAVVASLKIKKEWDSKIVEET